LESKTYDKYWTNWYYDECRYGHSWFAMKESKDKQMIKAASQLSTRNGDRSDYTPVTGADFKKCLGFDYPVIDSNPFVSSVSTAFLKTGSLTEADYIGWKLWTSRRPANKKISESTDKWSRECKETYERRIRNPQQW
jgi:hypothetical protein